MGYFVLYLFFIGMGVIITGKTIIEITTDLFNMLLLNGYMKIIFQYIIQFASFYIYAVFIEKKSIQIYRKCKFEFINPSKIEKVKTKIFASSMMLIFSSLVQLIFINTSKVTLPLVIIVTVLSIMFGFAEKQTFDALYKIQYSEAEKN